MRLLVVNSNTSDNITELIGQEARASARPETEVEAVTAPLGPRSVESRGELAVAAYGTLLALSEHVDKFDAAVIACFSDPGLQAARELYPIPIVGIAEAAVMTACLCGARFSVVTVGRRMEPVLSEIISSYGLSNRLASIRTFERPVEDIGSRPLAFDDEFFQAGRRAVDEDGADVIILGGAVTAGMGRRLNKRMGVPVLDGVSCAVRQAEVLASLRSEWAGATHRARPRAKEVIRVPKSLAARFLSSR
jgi:Asp/Glu/hydantoin racemase